MNEAINAYIRRNSGLELRRDYLGMSGISRCELQLYREFKYGIEPDDLHYRKCYQGYMYEGSLKLILDGAGILMPFGAERELVAPFDSRFRGHTDGEDCDGNLIELKSMTRRRWEDIKDTRRAGSSIYWQAQAYMRYGDYKFCRLWYVCTETLRIDMISIRANAGIQTAIEEKAKRLLYHIDINTPPACTCGRCA